MDMDTDNKDNLDMAIKSQSQAQANSEGGADGGEENITLRVQDQGGDTVR